MAKGAKLRPGDWVQVVVVAGIGSVLEWFDFYSYSQLDKTLKTVFFGAGASDTGYWLIFALAMTARPVGALLFGHIGDTLGRGKALALGIVCMALGTVAIGCLPTYDTGSYTAGAAATALLGVFRVVQGLAMGGEYGAAIVYISEMAGVKHRATLVALLQSSINVGLLLALALVMLLQNTISSDDMLIWGWRIPFILAFLTALLGYYLRRGMPEPHAFLAAIRKERVVSSKMFSKRQLTVLGGDPEWEALEAVSEDGAEGRSAPAATMGFDANERGGADRGSLPTAKDVSNGEESGSGDYNEKEEQFERVATLERGALSFMHRDVLHSKVPMLRVLRNNITGVCIQVCYSAWASGALYVTNSWLPSKLRAAGMDRLISQSMLLASIVPSLLGMWGTGWALDCGLPAIAANAMVVIFGAGAIFGVSYGSFNSTTAAWILSSLMFLVVGMALTLIGLPVTRIYTPLERITGFSFSYSFAMGFIGGFTPNISNAIQGDLSSGLEIYAGAFWLLALAGLSIPACVLLRAYNPRLNKRFVGHIE